LGPPAYEAAIAAGKLITKKDFPPFVPNQLAHVVLKSINPDPTQRFQSALEMRRALEKLGYPGHWTMDEGGKMIRTGTNYTYRFDRIRHSVKGVSFTALKKNRASTRETMIAAFCEKNLTVTEARNFEARFVKAVVHGKA
jgi:hypothetical protein